MIIADTNHQHTTAMNKPVEIDWLPERNEVKNIFADQAKCERVFGHTAETSLEKGIRKMTDWVMSHGPRQPVRFSNIELEKKRMPLGTNRRV